MKTDVGALSSDPLKKPENPHATAACGAPTHCNAKKTREIPHSVRNDEFAVFCSFSGRDLSKNVNFWLEVYVGKRKSRTRSGWGTSKKYRLKKWRSVIRDQEAEFHRGEMVPRSLRCEPQKARLSGRDDTKRKRKGQGKGTGLKAATTTGSRTVRGLSQDVEMC